LEYVRLGEILKRRLFLVLTALILAMTAGGLVCLVSPARYQAKAVLILDRTGPESGVFQPDYNSLMMYRQLARTYSELAASEPVLRKLSAALDQKLSPGELGRMVKVRKVKDLELLEVLVADTSPDRAAYIANKLAEILRQEERDTWKMSNLRLIAPAVPDRRPVGPDLPLAVFTAGLAGLFISVILAAAVDYRTGREES